MNILEAVIDREVHLHLHLLKNVYYHSVNVLFLTIFTSFGNV